MSDEERREILRHRAKQREKMVADMQAVLDRRAEDQMDGNEGKEFKFPPRWASAASAESRGIAMRRPPRNPRE